MLADLDRLLRERNLDAVLVPMHEHIHSSFRWLSRGAKVTRGYALKIAGRAPILITYPMEREEALATGLDVHLVHEFDHERIFRSAPNPAAAYGEFFATMLSALDAGSSVAFFGDVPIHLYLGIADALAQRGIILHRSNGEDLIQ